MSLTRLFLHPSSMTSFHGFTLFQKCLEVLYMHFISDFEFLPLSLQFKVITLSFSNQVSYHSNFCWNFCIIFHCISKSFNSINPWDLYNIFRIAYLIEKINSSNWYTFATKLQTLVKNSYLCWIPCFSGLLEAREWIREDRSLVSLCKDHKEFVLIDWFRNLCIVAMICLYKVLNR